jgi:hypothetical protein
LHPSLAVHFTLRIFSSLAYIADHSSPDSRSSPHTRFHTPIIVWLIPGYLTISWTAVQSFYRSSRRDMNGEIMGWWAITPSLENSCFVEYTPNGAYDHVYTGPSHLNHDPALRRFDRLFRFRALNELGDFSLFHT